MGELTYAKRPPKHVVREKVVGEQLGGVRPYLTQSVCKVVLQKSIPAETRQLILYNSN